MKRIIIVRSDRCTSSTDECNAAFVFPAPIVVPPDSDAHVQLMKVSFAHSYYLINAHTDLLVISGVSYALPHGNYNPATMLRYLHDTLPISVRYSPRSYKFEFSSTSAFTIGSQSTCLTILGITTAQCDASVTLLTGDRVSDLHGIHSIKVRTNFLVDSFDSGSSNGRDAHLLARIPVEGDTHEGSSYKYENYTPQTTVKMRVFDRAISEFTCSLLDTDDQHICFNGVPFSVKIMLEIIQRPGEKITPLFKSNASQTRTSHGHRTDQARRALTDETPSPREPPAKPTATKRRQRRATTKTATRIRPRKIKSVR